MSFKGIPLAYAAVGGLIAYSGIKGATLEDTFRAVLSGNLTLKNTESLSNPNVTASASTGVSGSASGAQIANDALQYVGRLKYVYGGAPGPSGTGPVDCSSFVSLVIGHDLGMAIPGGSWASQTDNGSAHGPTTTSYLAWTGATTVAASGASAGVLACWSTHVAVCINSTQCVSALNPTLGVAVTPTTNTGPTGEAVTYRKINAVPYGLS